MPEDMRHVRLREFLEMARVNTVKTFADTSYPIVRWLEELDELFRVGSDAKIRPGNDAETVLPYSLARSHSSFLAGVRVVSGGQVAVSHALSRLCLEHALYAFFICDDPERALTWARRSDSEAAKRRCRNLFRVGEMKKSLAHNHEELGAMVSSLYDRTIRYGAHPNVDDWILTSEIRERDGSTRMLASGTTPWELALQTVAQAGVCALKVFYLLYGERFDVLGVSERLGRFGPFLEKLREGDPKTHEWEGGRRAP